MPRTIALRTLLLAIPLIGCSREAADAEPPAVDPGLIVNPRFEAGASGKGFASWSVAQHAGASSYRFAAEDGTLVIRRIGDEPWGMVSQTLDVTEAAGTQLAFSMALAGEFDDSRGPPFQPPGLVVRIVGRGPSDPPVLGKRHLLAVHQDPGLPAGSHGWSRHELRFEVPEGRDLELTVGVQMTMDGELRARAPQLIVLDEAAVENGDGGN